MQDETRLRYYLRPSSEEELIDHLRRFKGKARIIAGGTALYEFKGWGLLPDIEALIDISRLNLSYIKQEDGILRIGSTVTISELMNLDLFKRDDLAAIGDAARAIQPIQVKNVATIGGSVCTALPFLDLPPALIALDALVTIQPGNKRVQLNDFIKGYLQVGLEYFEFVSEIDIPLTSRRRGSAFSKFSLTSDDWAIMNCAVSIELDESGMVNDSRIVFGGGVEEKPVRAQSIEHGLNGRRLSTETLKATFDLLNKDELPLVADKRGSTDYRLELAKVLGRRCIMQVASRLGVL